MPEATTAPERAQAGRLRDSRRGRRRSSCQRRVACDCGPAVLLDLSGFGAQHQGVVFELAHLLGSRPLDSFVLITDGRTDIDYLGATLTRLWRQMDPSLPNARLEKPSLRVLHKPNAHNLVAALCDAAAAQPVQSPA